VNGHNWRNVRITFGTVRECADCGAREGSALGKRPCAGEAYVPQETTPSSLFDTELTDTERLDRGLEDPWAARGLGDDW